MIVATRSLSNQLQRIFENQLEAHVFAGDVTHGASFVHMNDLVEALTLCVEKENPSRRGDPLDWRRGHI